MEESFSFSWTKSILIQSFLVNIPLHDLFIFIFHIAFASRLRKSTLNFFGEKSKDHLINWNQVCKLKDENLGFEGFPLGIDHIRLWPWRFLREIDPLSHSSSEVSNSGLTKDAIPTLWLGGNTDAPWNTSLKGSYIFPFFVFFSMGGGLKIHL